MLISLILCQSRGWQIFSSCGRGLGLVEVAVSSGSELCVGEPFSLCSLTLVPSYTCWLIALYALLFLALFTLDFILWLVTMGIYW